MATQLEHETDCRLERAIWQVWGFVRLNKDSLDSDRACKIIRKAFEDAAEELQAEIHKLKADLHAARAAVRELNKEE